MDKDAEKAALRKRMRQLRSVMGAEERVSLSATAAGYLLESPLWQGVASVALYMAARGEADPIRLTEDAWKRGKTVLLPLCGEEPGRMRLVPCSGPESLRVGAFGILEPDEKAVRLAERSWGGGAPPTMEASPDLIVVPGLAFTREGRRLGMGGGYYDRLAATPALQGVPRIGFAYAAQIVEYLPCAPWDLPVNAVCTEQGLVWIQ